MRRVFSLALLTGIIFLSAFSQITSAETVTLSENLAKAVASAELRDENGHTITATLTSQDVASGDDSPDIEYSVILSRDDEGINASDVASMNFDGADLDGITSGDFESFDVFSGLEYLRIALPDSFNGEFLPSFEKLSLLDVSGSTAEFILSLYKSVNVVSVDASSCSNLKAVNLALIRSETVSSDSGSDTSGMGGMFGGGQSSSELLSAPLSSLVSLNLSSNPKT